MRFFFVILVQFIKIGFYLFFYLFNPFLQFSLVEILLLGVAGFELAAIYGYKFSSEQLYLLI